AAAASAERTDAHAGFPGRAAVTARRRVRPHPGRQQQRLLPGQRNLLGELGPGPEERRTAALHAAADRPAQALFRPEPGAVCQPRPLARHEAGRPGLERASAGAGLPAARRARAARLLRTLQRPLGMAKVLLTGARPRALAAPARYQSAGAARSR